MECINQIPDATLLACSLDVVQARLYKKESHAAEFLSPVDAMPLASAVYDAIYGDGLTCWLPAERFSHHRILDVVRDVGSNMRERVAFASPGVGRSKVNSSIFILQCPRNQLTALGGAGRTLIEGRVNEAATVLIDDKCLRKVPYVGAAIGAYQLSDAIFNPTSIDE
jgi:hypothetical protein